MSAESLLAALVGTKHRAPLGGFEVTELAADEWGVYLGLSTHRHDDRTTEGSVYLMRPDRLDDRRALPFATGYVEALRAVIDRATPESAKSWAVGYFNVRMPLDILDEAATSSAFTARFLAYPWLGRLLPDRPKRAPAYERAPLRAVSTGSALDVDALLDWIYAFSQRTFTDPRWDEAMIRALPEPARVLDGLHTLRSMVGGNGFEVFLAQASGSLVRQTYDALEKSGAEQLRRLMAEGIGLAARGGAEFCQERSQKWLEPFEGGDLDAWSEIDGHAPDRSYALLASELPACAQRYAEAHRDELVAEPRPRTR